MSTTATIQASERPGVGTLLDEIEPVIGVIAVAGPPVILVAAPWLLLGLMLIGPFLLLVTFAVVALVASVLLALTAALLATPYLVARRILRVAATRRRRRGHRLGGLAPHRFGPGLAGARRA